MNSLQQQYNLVPGNYKKEMMDFTKYFRKEMHSLMHMATKRVAKGTGAPDNTQVR